jgi:hypothetical protein
VSRRKLNLSNTSDASRYRHVLIAYVHKSNGALGLGVHFFRSGFPLRAVFAGKFTIHTIPKRQFRSCAILRFAPKGQPHSSPGHRPGTTDSPVNPALKGPHMPGPLQGGIVARLGFPGRCPGLECSGPFRPNMGKRRILKKRQRGHPLNSMNDLANAIPARSQLQKTSGNEII